MTPLLPPSDLQDSGAKIAIVLGSGLGPFADSLEHRVVVPYSLVPGLPISKVPGHAGRFIVAQLDDRPILIAQVECTSMRGGMLPKSRGLSDFFTLSGSKFLFSQMPPAA